MKRSQQSVGTTQTGDAAGDGGTQGIQWKNKGGRNATTESAHRAAGQVAPRPKNSKEALLGASAHMAGTTAGMARVTDSPMGDSALRLPVQHPTANTVGTSMAYGGNGAPPAARGGPSRLRAGGNNQSWPNGPLYTDSAKKGSSGKDSGAVATRLSKRKQFGSNFFGDKSQ